ncbi:MAG: GGDEF domain-containing protein [Spirochaetia bacterium]|jgi:diguanylate cyclase (GGDEF)-like protein|nr:GGDEF domain-containing protein [Spirochaetia bacterium]
MKTPNLGNTSIRLGSFVDKKLESRFRAYELDVGYKSLSLVLPFLGILFFGFVLPDFFALGIGFRFWVLFSIRLLVLVMALLAPQILRPTSSIQWREGVLAAITLLGVLAFALALCVYREQNSYLQAISIVLMIGAQYLIPNRFLYSVGVSLFIIAMGVISLVLSLEPIPGSEIFALIVDFFIMALLSAIVWLRNCRSRRREYSKNLELELISKTDQLTGLGNRRHLDERFSEVKARVLRYAEPQALVLIDLDHFKTLNDNYGHEAGDETLKETARRFLSALRSEDFLCRWGGEEFVVLVSHAHEAAAIGSAHRLKAALSDKPMDLVGMVYASFGVTLIRADDDVSDTIARADTALYRAKNAGRNRVEFEP